MEILILVNQFVHVLKGFACITLISYAIWLWLKYALMNVIICINILIPVCLWDISPFPWVGRVPAKCSQKVYRPEVCATGKHSVIFRKLTSANEIVMKC